MSKFGHCQTKDHAIIHQPADSDTQICRAMSRIPGQAVQRWPDGMQPFNLRGNGSILGLLIMRLTSVRKRFTQTGNDRSSL